MVPSYSLTRKTGFHNCTQSGALFRVVDMIFAAIGVGIYLVVVILVVVSAAKCLLQHCSRSCTVDLDARTLFITAHPDDECMFFAPLILALTAQNRGNAFLLCLSEGNYYGDGEVRRKELQRSAVILNLNPDHVAAINDRQLQDGPGVCWPTGAIAKHILAAVKKHAIQKVVTFDSHGVSGHPNHIAIYSTVLQLCKEQQLVSVGVNQILLLKTTNVFRKYSIFLDLPRSRCSRFHVISSLPQYITARRAMYAHASQCLWFRKLYITFSRYLLTNTYEALE